MQTDEYSRLRLVTRGPNPLKEYPCEVLWDNWRVAPAPEPGDTVFRYDPPQAGKDNLIANGSFEQWVPGEAAPAGFAMDMNQNTGAMLFQDGRATDGELSVHQYWDESDKLQGAPKLFHTVVDNLEPETEYELRVKMNSLDAAPGRLVIYALRADNTPAEVLSSQQCARSKAFSEYTVKFRTENQRRAAITTKGPTNDGAYPTRALWDDWRLVRTEDAQ